MSNLESLERNRTKMIQPVAIPSGPRRRKDDLLPIRVNAEVKAYIESELAGLGLKTARDRQDFYRGAILAGISNAKRAESKAWKKFVAAIQPLARKHLGMGLELDGPREILAAHDDIFVTAKRQAAAKGPKYELTEEDLKAVAASREARARGEKDLRIPEAMKLIRKDL